MIPTTVIWFLIDSKTTTNVILRMNYLYDDPVTAHVNPLTSNIVQ